MMMFMGLAAMNSQANLLLRRVRLMIGILLSAASSARSSSQAQRHRTLPELAVVGQPTTVTYEFVNEKRFWPSLSVSVSELDGHEAVHAADRQLPPARRSEDDRDRADRDHAQAARACTRWIATR
jgi:hypothetical protein